MCYQPSCQDECVSNFNIPTHVSAYRLLRSLLLHPQNETLYLHQLPPPLPALFCAYPSTTSSWAHSVNPSARPLIRVPRFVHHSPSDINALRIHPFLSITLTTNPWNYTGHAALRQSRLVPSATLNNPPPANTSPFSVIHHCRVRSYISIVLTSNLSNLSSSSRSSCDSRLRILCDENGRNTASPPRLRTLDNMT